MATMRIRRTILSFVLAVTAIATAIRPVMAHQFTTRFDAPLPLPLLFAGAGATVALTAVLLFRIGEAPTGEREIKTVPGWVARPVRTLVRLGFLVAIVGAFLDGLTGSRVPVANFATLFVWAVWIKGLSLWAVLAGSPWRTLSPWRTVYEGLTRLEGETIRWRPYPDRLDYWPAFLGFVVLIGVAENLTRIPRLPTATAGVIAAYALVMLIGGLAFGPTWFERADPLSVLYRLLGRTAPLSVTRTRSGGWRLFARPPWHDCMTPVAFRAAVPFVVAAVYTVSFDGFAESPQYQNLYFAVRETFGVGPAVSIAFYVLGLVGFFLVYLGIVSLISGFESDEYLLEDDGGTVPDSGLREKRHPSNVRPNGSHSVGASRAFAASLIPIAGAYEVAHSYSYVFTYLGELPRVLGLTTVDPLYWLPLPAFWGSQVVLIVLGHVFAVVAAHGVASHRAPTGRRALIAHTPLIALMVAYTVLSLWIVSLPVAS